VGNFYEDTWYLMYLGVPAKCKISSENGSFYGEHDMINLGPLVGFPIVLRQPQTWFSLEDDKQSRDGMVSLAKRFPASDFVEPTEAKAALY